MIDNRIIIDGQMYQMIEQSYLVLNSKLYLSIDYKDTHGKFHTKRFLIGEESDIQR